MQNVPFLDLYSQYLEIKDKVDEAISSTISGSEYILGKRVSSFEEDFAFWNGSQYCIGCANGTDAIEIALEALGIGQGDEVIVPAMTWISTAEAVVRVGARVEFADIDKDSYCIDASSIEERITSDTKAVIAVHLYGRAADVHKIREICDRHGLFLIEDCAQAHGAMAGEKEKVGNIGHAGTFSFFPGKNLGAYGDAGCIITNDENLASVCREISNHGQVRKHHHTRIGRNSRLDGLQAAILAAKLPMLDTWLARRKNLAQFYQKHISSHAIKLPEEGPPSGHVFHLFSIQHENRDVLAGRLRSAGIETGVHYPSPLDKMKIFEGHRKGRPRAMCPNAELHASRTLSLPIGDQLSLEQAKYICTTLNSLENA